MSTFHHLIGATATSIALVLNSFLLVIILKYSSDKLGVYKHFLFAYTLNAVYYCFIVTASGEFLCAGSRRIFPQVVRGQFNRKIYILLTLQTIFPMVFNSSPVVITFVCATMKWFVGDYLLISGAVLSFAQVIDPLCIMILVSDYKNAIKEALGMVVLASRISSRVHSTGS